MSTTVTTATATAVATATATATATVASVGGAKQQLGIRDQRRRQQHQRTD